MPERYKLKNKKFSRLLVLEDVGTDEIGRSIWLCKCDCGTIKTLPGVSIVRGNTKSCGCLSREKAKESKNFTHNESKTNLYRKWVDIKTRCYNKNHKNYKYYGGRGIIMCDEWLDYVNFKEWALGNGYRKHLTIERIDNNSNYCPENCTWIPKIEQSNNQQHTRIITYNGKTQTMSAWARELNIKVGTLSRRLCSGWTINRALTEKVK